MNLGKNLKISFTLKEYEQLEIAKKVYEVQAKDSIALESFCKNAIREYIQKITQKERV